MGPGGASLDAAGVALGEPARPDPAHPLPQNPSLTRLTASYPLCRVLLRFCAHQALKSVDYTLSISLS